MLTDTYFDFFAELEHNNTKVWFDANRTTYEKYVREPFRALTAALIARIQEIEPRLQVEPRDAMFRINRDIRFSKDKSPYKTAMGAHISRFGRKTVGMPGFYIEVGARAGAVAGGSYQPERQQLDCIRDLLMHDRAKVHAALSEPSFVKHFGSIRGDVAKTVPKEFAEAARSEPLMYNKQFYWWGDVPRSVFTSKKCIDRLMEYYHAALPLQMILEEVLE
ncbi:MAG: DUF2461 domain-containing protein [Candidatus Kapabacteria bacterium]|nr:DUF2461 domain-containing protein [Candidatus Kapabacteria bacterium]